jgi:hypothetical protein
MWNRPRSSLTASFSEFIWGLCFQVLWFFVLSKRIMLQHHTLQGCFSSTTLVRPNSKGSICCKGVQGYWRYSPAELWLQKSICCLWCYLFSYLVWPIPGQRAVPCWRNPSLIGLMPSHPRSMARSVGLEVSPRHDPANVTQAVSWLRPIRPIMLGWPEVHICFFIFFSPNFVFWLKYFWTSLNLKLKNMISH